MFKGKKGFTLIELLIVMAVIAVLIGIAIPSFRGMQNEAKRAKAQGDMRVIKLAIEAYNAKNSAYPTSEAAVVGGAVIQTLPKDPFGDLDYGYILSTGGSFYAIWSAGEDTKTGTVTVDNTTGQVALGTDAADSIGTTNGTPPAGNTLWN